MKENTEISERIKQMLEALHITKNAFAQIIGYKRSQVLYDILNNKAKPSFDFFYKFVNSEYSEIINIEWLIAGKGEMFVNTNTAYKQGECPQPISEPGGIYTKENERLKEEVSVLREMLNDKRRIIESIEAELKSYRQSAKRGA